MRVRKIVKVCVGFFCHEALRRIHLQLIETIELEIEIAIEIPCVAVDVNYLTSVQSQSSCKNPKVQGPARRVCNSKSAQQ